MSVALFKFKDWVPLFRRALLFLGAALSAGPRTFCLECVLKHLSRARAYLQEAESSPDEYGHFGWWAVGELSHAEDEAAVQMPSLARFIRRERKRLSARRFLGYSFELNHDFFSKAVSGAETGDKTYFA